MKHISKIVIIGIVLYSVFHLIVFIYATNQILNHTVPFDYKKVLAKNKSEYSIDIDIGCNRYFKREIGIIFTPKYIFNTDDIFEITPIFKFDYEIKQDGKVLKKGSSKRHTTYGNITRILLVSYKPLDSFFCNKQNIKIVIKKAKPNLDFSKTELLFYVSGARSLA